MRQAKNIAWVVAADMGLGHKRAAWPLRQLAVGGVYLAGSAEDTDVAERELWTQLRQGYERISRLKKIPMIGEFLFAVYDRFQAIPTAYPFRDLSRPTLPVRYADKLIRNGIGRSLIKTMNQQPLPMVTTFYAAMLAAEAADWLRIYCVICDADLNRVWVPPKPQQSRVEYLVPCGKALRRLKQYGIPDERIYMTGFPLPLELTGNADLDVLRHDLGRRLARLDPNNRFWCLHQPSVEHFLGPDQVPDQRGLALGPLTVTFAVGGAGAQTEIGLQILRSLMPRLEDGSCRLNLVAGVRPEVATVFQAALDEAIAERPGLQTAVNIVFGDNDDAYFKAFADCLHDTDVLWTKPSELSFYAGLGLPIIMAPIIGAHEERNREWLLEVQAGIDQRDPRYTVEWLFDLWQDGRLAESAWDGFLKARKYGTYRIGELLATGSMGRSTCPLQR